MALRDDLYADVTSLLQSRCGVDPQEISEQTNLEDDLGLDSLDLIAIAMTLQTKYDLSLNDEGIASIDTVGDILTLVEERIDRARSRVAESGR